MERGNKARKQSRSEQIPFVCPKSRFTSEEKLFERKPKNKTTMRQVEKASDKKKTPQDDEKQEEEEEDTNAMEKQ